MSDGCMALAIVAGVVLMVGCWKMAGLEVRIERIEAVLRSRP